MNQVFTSWSGGKDSCLACYRAKLNGLNIRYLANTVTEDGKRSRSHGLLAETLKVQSQAIGIPLIQRPTTWDGYEDVFVDMLQELKQKNKELQAKIEEIKEENVNLKEERERLDNDIVYLERVAREKMGLAREGEIIYRMVPEE